MQELPLSDYRLAIDWDRNTKFVEFIQAIEMEEPVCGWLLVKFFQYVARFYPTGTIGKVNLKHLAREIRWNQEWGEVSILLMALVKAGYVDVSAPAVQTPKGQAGMTVTTGHIEVHNWLIRQPHVGNRAKSRIQQALKKGYKVNPGDPELAERSGQMTNDMRNQLKVDKVARKSMAGAGKKKKDCQVRRPDSTGGQGADSTGNGGNGNVSFTMLKGIGEKTVMKYAEAFQVPREEIIMHLLEIDQKMVDKELSAPKSNPVAYVNGLLQGRLG